MTKFEAVILDIDGTLSPEISWYALTQGLGASAAQHKTIYDLYKNGEVTYDESKQQLISLWQATGNTNKECIKELFEKWELFPDVDQTVKELKQVGYRLCIITGSFDSWAKVVAKRLRVDHWFANTELVWDEDDNLVDMHYEIQQSKRKLEQLKAFCDQLGVAPEKCAVVGDSENDIDLFIYTGNGIAVGAKANDELVQKSWKVIQDFADIKKLLITN